MMSIPEVETNRKVGKPAAIADRTIYPILETYITKDNDFTVIEIFPIALVIREQDYDYVISLTEDNNELMDMVFKKGL